VNWVPLFTRRSLLGGLALAVTAEPIHLPRKLRVAIVGLDGHPEEIVKPLDRLPDVEIVAISERDAALAHSFVASSPRLAGARKYDDYQVMLDTEKPDLVAVCNNDGERAAVIIACAERGLDVIAEKPLAINRRDLYRIHDTVTRHHTHLGMLLPMRFEPPYLALKQVVASGQIGEVIQISAQKSYQLGKREDWYKHRELYGSTILWIGIHMLDLMRWTSGQEFTQVSSFMGRPGFPGYGDMETTTATALRLNNAGTATLHMDYCRPRTALDHGDDRLRLAGTKGVAEYMAATGVTLMTATAKPTVVRDLPQAGSVFIEFLEHVYQGKPTTLPQDEIFRICHITLGAHEAAESGKVVSLRGQA
jgi:predicted dehydrogenase